MPWQQEDSLSYYFVRRKGVMTVKLDPQSMMNGFTLSNKENNTNIETDSFYEGIPSKTPFVSIAILGTHAPSFSRKFTAVTLNFSNLYLHSCKKLVNLRERETGCIRTCLQQRISVIRKIKHKTTCNKGNRPARQWTARIGLYKEKNRYVFSWNLFTALLSTFR
jgi:hypothetical protein